MIIIISFEVFNKKKLFDLVSKFKQTKLTFLMFTLYIHFKLF